MFYIMSEKLYVYTFTVFELEDLINSAQAAADYPIPREKYSET